MVNTRWKYFWGLMYLVSIMLGNLFVIWFGIVHCLGLTFPAGVVFIGLTFSFRDFMQRHWGKWGAWVWMLAATVITLFLNWQVAVASVVAFIVSEGLDWVVFTYFRWPFRKRIYLSNLVSCPMDSLLFVTIAFGPVWPAIWGQALIKYLSGLLVLPFIKKDYKVE